MTIKSILLWATAIASSGWAYGQSSCYDMIKKVDLPVAVVPERDTAEVRRFESFIEQLHFLDKSARTKHANETWKLIVADSETYWRSHAFFKQAGYFSSIRDADLAKAKDPDRFCVHYYVLQIHSCDYNPFGYLKVIERNIRAGKADEKDLMDYFITYLWRRTEFPAPYCAFPIPDLQNGPYSIYYRTALQRYVAYCYEHNPTFQVAIIKGIRNSEAGFDFANGSLVQGLNIPIVVKTEKHPLKEYWRNRVRRLHDRPYVYEGPQTCWFVISSYPEIYHNPGRYFTFK